MGVLKDLIKSSEYEKVTLLSGKEIGIKAWRVKQEKDFLYRIEGVNPEDDGSEERIQAEVISLLRTCVDDQKVFDNLSEVDVVYALVEARKRSKGTEVDFTYNCTNMVKKVDRNGKEYENECQGKNNPALIDLDTDLKTDEFNTEPIVVDDFTFTLKEVPLIDKLKLKATHGDTLSQYNYYYLIKSVDVITSQGESYTEFTDKELMEFIDSLTSPQLEKLYDALRDRFSAVYIDKLVKCPLCKNESQVLFRDMYGLLVF